MGYPGAGEQEKGGVVILHGEVTQLQKVVFARKKMKEALQERKDCK